MRFAAWLLLALPLPAQEDTPLRVDVNLVPVTVSITDKSGRPIDDIKLNELKLFDNGKPREIRYFARDVNVPLTIGLIADMSGSQLKWFEEHRQHLKQFITQVLQPGDRAFLMGVAGNPRLVQDLTGSVQELQDAVDGLPGNVMAGPVLGDPCPAFKRGIGGNKCQATPLWNSVYSAARLRMREVQGRKALVILSDGFDTGSQHSLNDAIEAAQGADVAVYSLYSPIPAFARFAPTPIMFKAFAGKGGFRRLAEDTGGAFYSADDDLGAVFARIEAELRSLYVLGFVLPDEARDGAFHKLEVQSTRPGVRVRARKGYTAGQP